jgi:hypothetical protein
MGKRIDVCRVLWGNLRERDHLEDPDINGRTIISWGVSK